MKIEEVVDIFDFFEYNEILDQIPEERIMDYLLDLGHPSNLLGYFDTKDLIDYLGPLLSVEEFNKN